MGTKSVITRVVTVAGGRFAPGHLGELTRIVPFEITEEVAQPPRLHHLLGREAYQTACARNRRSRRLLATTHAELNAIAAPAIMGLSNPNAASGIAAVL